MPVRKVGRVRERRRSSPARPKCIGELGEFELIDRIEEIARGARALRGPGIVLGIGDDAALLRPRAGRDLVVTTDTSIEDVHFRWRADAAAAIGRRALVANLSDLAAMGARPLGFTLALAAPPDLTRARFEGALRGLLREAAAYACPLVGGNVARARETSLTIGVIGEVERGRALRRSSARAGDRLFVTGTLGGAALARRRAERSGKPDARVPVARIAAGRALARLGVRVACIDVSDGLAADLAHLLDASGVGAEVDAAALPRPRNFAAACSRVGLDPLATLAGGGEDYELVFALRGASADATGLARRLGVAVAEIGRVRAEPGLSGLPSGGWTHFRGGGKTAPERPKR